MVSNRNDEYRMRDLHTECEVDPDGEWPPKPMRRYGGVTFNRGGMVLLREPKNHFGGFHWTFSKGAPDKVKDKHPVDTAIRETLEETGHRPEIIGHVRGVFQGGVMGSANYFYVMLDRDGIVDTTAMERNGETNAVRWVSKEEAHRLISESTDEGGRDRDLRTLQAAYDEFERLKTL